LNYSARLARLSPPTPPAIKTGLARATLVRPQSNSRRAPTHWARGHPIDLWADLEGHKTGGPTKKKLREGGTTDSDKLCPILLPGEGPWRGRDASPRMGRVVTGINSTFFRENGKFPLVFLEKTARFDFGMRAERSGAGRLHLLTQGVRQPENTNAAAITKTYSKCALSGHDFVSASRFPLYISRMGSSYINGATPVVSGALCSKFLLRWLDVKSLANLWCRFCCFAAFGDSLSLHG